VPSNRVLIVDDDVAVVEVLEALLKRLNLPTETASSYQEAVAQLAGTPFGCALVDKNLPDKGGHDVVNEVRRQQPYCACIMMTGFPTLESSLQALRAGVADYIEKPFQDLELVGRKVTSASLTAGSPSSATPSCGS
jgi:DNA-binding NtrC family response regulator